MASHTIRLVFGGVDRSAIGTSGQGVANRLGNLRFCGRIQRHQVERIARTRFTTPQAKPQGAIGRRIALTEGMLREVGADAFVRFARRKKVRIELRCAFWTRRGHGADERAVFIDEHGVDGGHVGDGWCATHAATGFGGKRALAGSCAVIEDRYVAAAAVPRGAAAS